jgi:bisphosphoglycerate-independent phosphoglycerate mutase (AlkP superfamily)
MKPEMSAFELTDDLAENIESQKYDLIICNFRYLPNTLLSFAGG